MKVYTNKAKYLKTEIFDEALKMTDNNVGNESVGITFVSKCKIKKLNKLFRGKNKVTDVLSFPLYDTRRFATLKNFESERDPLTKELEIGDIVICTSMAKSQAKKYNHSFKREVNFLALHGFLHLLGYDHLNEEDENQMFALSESILKKVNLNRGEHV